ncbi:hypothetical protein DV707_05930 [Halobellus limi]|uniref:Uncharacterized protein n=1 Tax=Halobellus limi TaxID=699433 RepID=A0A4D6H0D9_9EURY|nr:hypothetical protein [Halobellus limi]QCC47245.1 hypothetical protein DV707_05930 [Halobellus limi]
MIGSRPPCGIVTVREGFSTATEPDVTLASYSTVIDASRLFTSSATATPSPGCVTGVWVFATATNASLSSATDTSTGRSPAMVLKLAVGTIVNVAPTRMNNSPTYSSDRFIRVSYRRVEAERLVYFDWNVPCRPVPRS